MDEMTREQAIALASARLRLKQKESQVSPVEAAPADDSFSVGEMASNIPSSAGKLVKNLAGGLYQTVRHPIKTAQGLGTLAEGIVDKGAEMAHNAVPQDLRTKINKVNNSIPFMTKLPESGEVRFDESHVGEAVGEAIKNRYGSKEAILNTLEADPVGVLADAAAVVYPVSAKASAALNPVNATINTVKYGSSKLIPKSAPANMYQKSAKFSTTIPQEKRSRMINTALDEGIMPTFKGVDKIKQLTLELGQEVGRLIDDATAQGKRIPKKALFTKLKSLRQEVGPPHPTGNRNLATINRVVKEQIDNLDSIDGDYLTPRQAQTLKTDLQRLVSDWDKSVVKSSKVKNETYKSLSRGARGSIENAVPDVKPINQRLSDLRRIEDHVERSANRIGNNNAIPINAPLDIMAGSVVADKWGALLGALTGIAESPKPRAWTALQLHRLKKQGLPLYLQNNEAISAAELAAIMAGRATQSDQISQ